MQTNMASDSRWALRSRSLTAIGIAAALVTGAVGERVARAQAQQAPWVPPSGSPDSLQTQPKGSQDTSSPEPDSRTGVVPQRSDRETPRS